MNVRRGGRTETSFTQDSKLSTARKRMAAVLDRIWKDLYRRIRTPLHQGKRGCFGLDLIDDTSKFQLENTIWKQVFVPTTAEDEDRTEPHEAHSPQLPSRGARRRLSSLRLRHHVLHRHSQRQAGLGL